jgi:hypothetical protein
MFLRLLVTFISLIIVVQSTVTNSSKGQIADALTLPKQSSAYEDYDLNDQKTLGNNVEGSGGAASIDEYADDEEEEQLSKVTATTLRTNISTITTTIPTTTLTTTKRTTSTTTFSNKWMKTTFNYEQINKKNQSSTTLSTVFNDLDGSEFKDDQEEYTDDLEDDSYYNEPTVSNKIPSTSFSTTRYPNPTTRQTFGVNHTAPIWILFTFLTRPPIAAGILAGKKI